MSIPLPESTDAFDDSVARAIIEAVRGIRFGAVEIVVHDGRVVQIERKEKLRFEQFDPKRRAKAG